jgi:NAD(P)-dependent dehydrogenase (short-subunit alcohol dehydrogenase family)/acyl carrier protein
MDSRSLDFADEIMRITNGQGVDIVLNSLSGEFITKSLSTLAPGGRFLEIGKVDIVKNSQLGLGLLENNIAFFTIDLGRMFVARPSLWTKLLREVIALFEAGAIEPLLAQVFPLSQAPDAFRYMAQGKHIGKIVLTMREDEVQVAPPREVSFGPDGTYLITGGAGGLGLSVAQWMVARGARHLALVGRSGANAAAEASVEQMRQSGAQVAVMRADVAQEQQVADVLAEIRRTMPPLKGIIHAAGVLDDGIMLQLTQERFAPVMSPKINGAWNLHRLTLEEPLEHFILFSSGASVLGNPGQGNYVAANAFLDALAHHRRACGLPGIAINWGAWAEVGLAAREDRAKNLTQQGIVPFTPAQGVQLLGLMLQRNPEQVMAVAMDWSRVVGVFPSAMLSQIAAELAVVDGTRSRRRGDGLTREKLLAAEPDTRRQMIETFLLEQVARVLRSSASKLDILQPLNNLGIDSLMAVELKNRVETDLEMSVPVTVLLQGPSIAQLTTALLDQLPATTSAPAGAPEAQEIDDQVQAQVDELSDEEVDELLNAMANEVGR